MQQGHPQQGFPQQGYPQQGYAAAPGVQPMNPTDEKTWSILLHLGPIIVSFLVPLIGYLVLKDRGPFIRHNAVQALNFTLTMLIGYVASYLLMLVLIGFITLPIVWVLSIVFAIIAAVKTNKGEYYTYPFSIKFVK